MGERRRKLRPDEREEYEAKLPEGWRVVDGTRLERAWKFNDFVEALNFVNVLGALAERMNHHPDLELSWGRVACRVTTHSAGGLSELDFEFARRAELAR